jgi:hypothetical protein
MNTVDCPKGVWGVADVASLVIFLGSRWREGTALRPCRFTVVKYSSTPIE